MKNQVVQNPEPQDLSTQRVKDQQEQQVSEEKNVIVPVKSKKFSKKKKIIIITIILVLLGILGLGLGLFFALKPKPSNLNTSELIVFNRGQKLSYLHEFGMKDSSRVKTYQVDQPQGSNVEFANNIQVYVVNSEPSNVEILIGIEQKQQQSEQSSEEENDEESEEQTFLFKVTFGQSFTLKQIVAVKKGAKQSVIEYLLIVIDQLTPRLKADLNNNQSPRSLQQSNSPPQTQENIYCRKQITSQNVVTSSDEEVQLQKQFSNAKCLELQPSFEPQNQDQVREFSSTQVVTINKLTGLLIKDEREQTFYVGQKLSKQEQDEFFEQDQEDQIEAKDQDLDENQKSESQDGDGRSLSQGETSSKQRKNQKMILDYSVSLKGTMELKQNSLYDQSQVSSMLASLSQNETLTLKFPEDLNYIHSMDKDPNVVSDDNENQQQKQNQNSSDRNLSTYNFLRYFDKHNPKTGLQRQTRVKNKSLFDFKVLGSRIHGGAYLGAAIYYSKSIDKEGHFYLSAGGGAYIDTPVFDFNYHDFIAGGIRLKYVNDDQAQIDVGRVRDRNFVSPSYTGYIKLKLAASVLNYKTVLKKWQDKGKKLLDKSLEWGKRTANKSWQVIKNIFKKDPIKAQFERIFCKALLEKTQIGFDKEQQNKSKKCLELLQKYARTRTQQVVQSIKNAETVKKSFNQIKKVKETIQTKVKEVVNGEKLMDLRELRNQIIKEYEKLKDLELVNENFEQALTLLEKSNQFYKKECQKLITLTVYDSQEKKKKECIEEFKKLGDIYTKKLTSFLSENISLQFFFNTEEFKKQLNDAKTICQAFETQVDNLKRNFNDLVNKLTNFLIQKSGEIGVSMRKYFINRTKRIYHKCFMVWIIPVCFNAQSYVRAYIQGSVKPVSMKGHITGRYYVNMSASGYANIFVARGGLRVLGTVVDASLPLSVRPHGYSNYNLIRSNFKLPSYYCFDVHLHARAFRVVLQPFYSVRRVSFGCRRWFRCYIRISWRDYTIADIVLFRGWSRYWRIFGTCPRI